MAQGLRDFKSRGSHAAVPFADDEPPRNDAKIRAKG
jgi:hypothetical protein